MRLIVMALLFALVTGVCQASVLQGGDQNATVVLIGAHRMPNLADENGTTEILKVDVGLMGADNATYQLLDADNNWMEPYKYIQLSSGRQDIFFLIPSDSLFKLINVTPAGGKPIYLNWWATPKGSSNKVIVRYYGITDWQMSDYEQGIVVQVRVQNNGTESITVTPENFTLFDQWGWPYYPTAGFDSEVVAPGEAQSGRVLVGFTGVSLQSRPAALAYDYNTPDQVVIDFERDLCLSQMSWYTDLLPPMPPLPQLLLRQPKSQQVAASPSKTSWQRAGSGSMPQSRIWLPRRLRAPTSRPPGMTSEDTIGGML